MLKKKKKEVKEEAKPKSLIEKVPESKGVNNVNAPRVMIRKNG